jgi:RecB family exonuclease
MKYSPYSFSKIDTFEQCKYKFKLQYIDKVEVPSSNIHLERGTLFHHLLEHTNHFSRDCSKFPDIQLKLISKEEKQNIIDKYNAFIRSPMYQRLSSLPVIGNEIEFGLDKSLNPINYYNKDCIIRGKIDLLSISENNDILIVDWKTGKVKTKSNIPNTNQLTLYAIWVFKVFGREKTTGIFSYVEHDNVFNEYEFDIKQLPEYAQAFGKKISAIEKEEIFEKKVTKLCDWCKYKNHGICTI